MSRTDVHAPKNLITEHYEFAYAYDAHPTEGDRGAYIHEVNRLVDEGFTFGQIHGGDTCDHCGTPLRYVAVLKHLPTRTLIKVGETCLDNRFSLATAEFHTLRKQAKLNRERATKAERYAAWLTRPEAQEAHRLLLGSTMDPPAEWVLRNEFLSSCASRLTRCEPLSEAQLAAVLRVKAKQAEFDAERAERDAAMPAPADVIEGRGFVRGLVLSVKFQENAFGGRDVMTVVDDRGFKVWGSVPAAIENVQRGERVAFVATVTTSDRDSTFGFFKRPAQATIC